MKMRKLLLLLISLLLLGAFGYYYRDSFIRKITLSDPRTHRGVVFHDRIRATDGYHLLDHYIVAQKCSFIDVAELDDFTLPGSFCTILEDGSYISYFSGQLTFWKPDGSLSWKKHILVHHDISVDENKKTIFVISNDFLQKKGEKDQTRFDSVRGYNFSGDELFHWRMIDNKRKLEAALQKSLPRYFLSPYFQSTHFNSVQEIPENPTAAKISAFRPGNILVNDFFSGALFIIDRNTKEIVWHLLPKEWLNAHSARVDKEGNIVFLANSHEKDMSAMWSHFPKEWLIAHSGSVNGESGIMSHASSHEDKSKPLSYSSIDYFDPVAEKVVHSIAMFPKESFFTAYLGSLQHLPGDRFLVTNSNSGSAFEIDKSGRIFWEWVNPENSEQSIYPTYRVQVASKSRIRKALSIWNPW